MPAQSDIVMPFVFDALPIRGAIIQLESSWRRMLPGHDYRASVLETLGHSAEDDLRVFRPRGAVFRCRCSHVRVEDVLRLLGEEETSAVLAEQGRIEVICEYCGRVRHYDSIDIERLFAGGSAPPSPTTH